jgi:hypothetical protein
MKFIFSILAATLIAASPAFADNSQDPGTIAVSAPSATAPIWAKLVLTGNVVTCYYATGTATPSSWVQVGQPEAINFTNNALLVGMYVTSHNTSAITSGTIDNFSITPASTFRLADSDIGSPSLMGSANVVNNVWTLTGSGADIWGTSDQFNFQPWLVLGDCTIVCRITSVSAGGDPWEKVGIMIRDSYNSGSDYAMFCASLGNGVSFQYRLSATCNDDVTNYVAPTPSTVTSTVAIGMGNTGTTAYQLRP